MNRALVFAFVVVATGVPMAAEAESPDRVDPVLDCATPVLDADTPEKARLLRVQYGADAMVRQLRQTYAPRLAGLFWEETEGEDSRLVLRLTGDEPVQNERMTVCGELLIVEFVPGQMHTREELQKIHSNNLEWFRGKFPGLQGPMPTNARARLCCKSTSRRQDPTLRRSQMKQSPAWRPAAGRDDHGKGGAAVISTALQVVAASFNIAFQSSASGQTFEVAGSSLASSRNRDTNASPCVFASVAATSRAPGRLPSRRMALSVAGDQPPPVLT